MKKLSLALAITMLFTAFSVFAVPASADEYGAEFLDFDAVTDTFPSGNLLSGTSFEAEKGVVYWNPRGQTLERVVTDTGAYLRMSDIPSPVTAFDFVQGTEKTDAKIEAGIYHFTGYFRMAYEGELTWLRFYIYDACEMHNSSSRYGAQNKKRIYQTIKLSTSIAVCIMLVGVVIFQLFPQTLLGLFEASEHMLEIGVPALRTISLSFVFAGFCIVSSCVFQALGNGVYSMFMSLARQIVVILPVAFVFAKLFGLNMVWFAYPIAEVVSVIMCIFMLKRIIKAKVKPLAN